MTTTPSPNSLDGLYIAARKTAVPEGRSMSESTRHADIDATGLDTNRLMSLALSVVTVPGKSELYGRDHAFYAIGPSREAAIEFVLNNPDEPERRRMACRALALAGYEASGVLAMPDSRVGHLRVDYGRAGDITGSRYAGDHAVSAADRTTWAPWR